MGKIAIPFVAMLALALTAGCSHQETPAPVVSSSPTASAAPVVPEESRQKKRDFIASMKQAREKNTQAAQQQKP